MRFTTSLEYFTTKRLETLRRKVGSKLPNQVDVPRPPLIHPCYVIDWHASANKSQMLEIFKSFHPDLLKVLKYVALAQKGRINP